MKTYSVMQMYKMFNHLSVVNIRSSDRDSVSVEFAANTINALIDEFGHFIPSTFYWINEIDNGYFLVVLSATESRDEFEEKNQSQSSKDEKDISNDKNVFLISESGTRRLHIDIGWYKDCGINSSSNGHREFYIRDTKNKYIFDMEGELLSVRKI